MFKNLFRCSFTLSLILGFTSPGQAQFQRHYAADELLVKFGNSGSHAVSARSANAAAANAVVGARKIRDLNFVGGWQHVRLPRGKSVQTAIAEYKSLKGVVDVEPNYVTYANAVPSDPSYSQLWGMAKISAPTAWNTTTGNGSVVVAVVDSGIDYNHPDLAANMWRNPGESGNGKENNRVDDDGNGYIDDVFGINVISNTGDPMDDNSHGTHCAGTIGAVGNNNVGVSGVNWNVKVMALKHLDADGSGYTSDFIECYNYLIARRKAGVNVRVANNSWGWSGGFSQSMKDAFDAAGNAGILSICAAGNDGVDNSVTPYYPSDFTSPSIISVAASDQNDNRASFSNWGATSVDLAAPGVSILSTTRNNTYAYFRGTSMAAPHVAGAAALVLSNESLSVTDLKARLLNSVDVLPQWHGLTVTGGRLNVARAVGQRPGAPVAQSQSLAIDEDKAKSMTLTATNASGGTLTYSILSGPQHGVLTGTLPNLTYTPAANYNGSDSFTFKANDGTLDSNTAKISLTVNPINDAPVARDITLTTNEDTVKSVQLFASDIEGAALSYTIVTQPIRGTLSGSIPNLTYTPASNYSGTDSFAFKVSDGALSSNTATVSLSVTPVNDAPVATNDTAALKQDGNVSIRVLDNDSDVDGSVLSISSVTQGANGSVSINADGSILYTPAKGFLGGDSFGYTINDGRGGTATATVNVTMSAPTANTPVSSLPTLNISDVSITEGAARTTRTARFTLTLSRASTSTVSVNYATVNGTAAAGSDYKATSGKVTFTRGSTTRTIAVVVIGNAILEADETFFLKLSNANGANLVRLQGNGIILNDDKAPPQTSTMPR